MVEAQAKSGGVYLVRLFGWLMLAVISFLMAWVAWKMVDRYNAIQSSLMQLPNPPTLTQHLWVPMMVMVAKLSLLLVAYSTGLAIAKERSQQNIWYLLINRRNEITTKCMHKPKFIRFKAT